MDEDAVKLKTLADHGIKITSPTPELKEELVKVGKQMWEEFIADTRPAVADTINKYRAEIGK
jgi:hypothetical protein